MVTRAQAYWLNRQRRKKRRGGLDPRIDFELETVYESASVGALWGLLSTSNTPDDWGTSTYSIDVDDDGVAQIDGDRLEVGGALDYETATEHFVTVKDTPSGPYDPITRVLRLPLLNVLEVTLNDPLTIDNDELVEASAAGTLVGTISGKTSGSTLTLIDDAGGRFALDGVDIEAGSVAVAIASYNITVRETHPDAATVDTVFTINGVAEASTAIAAPTEVTWIDATNPPLFDMLVQEVAPDEVQVGDIPQIRYNGAGTVYSGAAVASFPLVLDFSGAGLPTLGEGAGYGQVRFVRDPGGPGEVIGDWSSASEGAFEIAAAGLTYEFAGWITNDGIGGDTATDTLDLGAASAGRFVLLGVMSDGYPAIVSVPFGLPEITEGESWGLRAFHGDFVTTGSGPVEMTVEMDASTSIKAAVFIIRGSTGLVVKDFKIGSTATVAVEAGDIVIAIQLYDNTEPWTNSPTEPADNVYPDGSTEFWKGWSAVFAIDAPNAAFFPGVASGRQSRTALIVLGEA